MDPRYTSAELKDLDLKIAEKIVKEGPYHERGQEGIAGAAEE